MPQFRKLSYEKRLRKLKLTTLKERRQRGDMIEVFKLLAGVENIDCNQFFTPVTTCYAFRGHDRKLVTTRSRLDIRKFFFSQRVVNSWNSLPASVVQATSVNMFKNSYDRHLVGGMDVWATSCLSINLQVQVQVIFPYYGERPVQAAWRSTTTDNDVIWEKICNAATTTPYWATVCLHPVCSRVSLIVEWDQNVIAKVLLHKYRAFLAGRHVISAVNLFWNDA